MHRSQLIVLAAAGIVLVAMILFPPYFVIDRESGGRSHAFIGYHWIGHPPSAAYAYEKLNKDNPAGVDPARIAAFEVRLNVVRLARNIIILAALVALLMMRFRPRSREGG